MTDRRDALEWTAAAIAVLLALALVASSRPAKAATDADARPPATHLLVSCLPPADCHGDRCCQTHGAARGHTACNLDAASLANLLPKGSRTICWRVK